MRVPVLLSAVLVLPAASFADIGVMTPEIMEGARQLNRSVSQRPAPPQDDGEALKDVAALADSGLDLKALKAQGWSDESQRWLGRAIRVASDAVRAHHRAHGNPVSDAYNSGTLTNIDESFKAAIRALTGNSEAKKSNYKRGCLEHQAATCKALRQIPLPGVEVWGIVLGSGLEHHALVAFPRRAARPGVASAMPADADWEGKGVVLDGWLNQSWQPKEMVFHVSKWKGGFLLHRLISGTIIEPLACAQPAPAL